MTFDDLKKLPSCEEEIAAVERPVYIYGMGNGGEKVLGWCAERGIEVRGVFASDGFVRGQSFCGYEVMSLGQAEEKDGAFTVLLAFGTDLEDVMANIDDIEKKHPLFAPDVPVVGEGSFTKAGFLERLAEAEKVYSLLADEQSRQVFLGLTAYKITGKLSYLREVFTDEQKPSPLLGLGGGEVCVDLGAYNGDTVLQTAAACGYKKIYALEPEKRNFQKCVRNCAELDNTEFINAAAWSHDTVLNFDGGSGRQAKLDGKGRILTAARSVDSVLNGRECTYIKYDVEGADIPALKGSAETIRRYRPKLCCALYHRCYDYIDIPLFIEKLQGGYTMYMRQQRYYPAWETELLLVYDD
ncbi:FkbM family methyltransferase [Ruminococcus sp.]|uniref:FkbM family methyltransferase n=1 Tax=Ruminococcus sp. TaxID=41978 RepID=UPI0025FC5EEE|nr:FkbM family methyltransferase [Ruminococcus sp.]MBQ8966753.1 FkbM family methyltransferase [Ruminococcus sp.]